MASSSDTGSGNRFQGIQYFWDAVKAQSQNRHESALALLHWMLIGNGYQCIGRDNEFPATQDPNRLGSERLPENWNDRSVGFYSLLYIYPKQSSNMYLVKLIPAASINDSIILGQILIFNAAEDVIPFELQSHKYIPENWKTFSTPVDFPEFKAFCEFVDKEILGKMQPKRNAQSVSAIGRDPSSSMPFGQIQPPPSRPIPFMPDAGPPMREFIPPGPSRNPFALGSRDLDPFGGMGGNMMGPGHFLPPGFPGTNPVRPYRYDPMVPPEFGPHGAGPFRGDPLGVDPSFPGRGHPFGVGSTMPRLPRAPLQPGEPDPDHERMPPPTFPGDDLHNMFM